MKEGKKVGIVALEIKLNFTLLKSKKDFAARSVWLHCWDFTGDGVLPAV